MGTWEHLKIGGLTPRYKSLFFFCWWRSIFLGAKFHYFLTRKLENFGNFSFSRVKSTNLAKFLLKFDMKKMKKKPYIYSFNIVPTLVPPFLGHLIRMKIPPT
jgi:hypothetical protein